MSAHKPGVLKQVHKAHKTGRHRSKHSINENRARKSVRDLTKPALRNLSKDARRALAVQRRKERTASVLEERRSAEYQAPTLVSIIPFAGSLCDDIIDRFEACDDTTQRSDISPFLSYITVPRFKSRLAFLKPNVNDLNAVLDAVKASDVVMLCWPIEGNTPEDYDEELLSLLLAHGLPSIVHVVRGLSTITSHKQKEAAKKNLQKNIDKWSLNEEKLLNADSLSDHQLIIRHLSNVKKRRTTLQKRHSHMLVENFEVANEKDGKCTLRATGYVRGLSLNVDRLVHIQGCGDFQLELIEVDDDPHSLKNRNGMGEGRRVAARPTEKQETLQSEVIPDPLDAEQTWPDEHDKKMEKKATTKLVPKGTSSYQAAWILDDEDEAEDEEVTDDDSDEDDEEAMDAEESEAEEENGAEESGGEEGEMEEMDDDNSQSNLDRNELDKYREERENSKWPDEVDTPLDQPARVRFQKYRGLKSFRTSPWDAYENLPRDYARIFQFQDFRRTRKIVLAAIDEADEEEEKGKETRVPTGTFATVHISGVPTFVVDEWRRSQAEGRPIVLFQLLPHEQKMSVANLFIRKHQNCTIPIRNKTPLVFHVGFRRFEATPTFSQHTNGDKFKMERFLRPDAATVASVYAPITFPPATVLVFTKDGKLVASGSVLDVRPTRVVLKRIVLSGHPFKINKRSVVTRYMFFNREDIEWFKPVELHTPRGRRGHINEAIGTHGHMKCRFDQQLNAQESVMMSLYKRVFPKWTYNPVLIAGGGGGAVEEKMEM